MSSSIYITRTVPHVLLAVLVVLATLPMLTSAQTGAASTSAYEAGTTPELRQNFRYWRQSGELQQKIAALPGSANAAVLMPVLFGVSVADISPNFGDPRDGGARTHEGEDIIAVKGTPIVSPTPAVVIRMGTGPGEGNYVTTANPGGETFVYMHLDRFGEGVAAGSVLAQGGLIGYVGNTGNASGGAAHLHLEIHDSSGTPTDPYPRLTAEFSPAQKMAFLTTIFGQTADPVALSQFLVTNFRSTFTSAEQSGITLPPLITGALASVPAAAPTGGNLPTGDLMLGSSGSSVVSLQQFLIAKSSGSAAARLAGAGATGYFGPITQAALVEYQNAAGITPADGYYGPLTRSAVSANAGTQAPATTPAASGTAFTRDLYYGVSGQDVFALQVQLNALGFSVAPAGSPGSVGHETSYFGPATRSAVIAFQLAHAVSPPVGYFGPLTHAALAAL